MDRTALHVEIRNAISISDELSRREHSLGKDELAGCLGALRSSLHDLERVIGRSHADADVPEPPVVEAVERALQALLIRRGEVPQSLRSRTEQLLASAERVSLALWDPDERIPSKPVLGALPLARVIPQDVHSVLDYVHTAGFALSAALARTTRGRVVGVGLALGLGGMSSVTDVRFSGAKRLPVEVHERLDYVAGITAILAPFALGYAKKDPVTALLQVGLGIGHLVTSLISDYRADRGITLPVRGEHRSPSSSPP